jgi:hypothetical protein
MEALESCQCHMHFVGQKNQGRKLTKDRGENINDGFSQYF